MGISAVKAVFLDRDGVLNQAMVRNGKPYPPASAEGMRIIEGARQRLEELRRLGLLLIAITNQPDLARGTQTPETVERMHAHLRAELPLDDILVCPHDDADHCHCRKPKPGLLQEAERRYGIDLSGSFLIGDRWRDIDAGHAAGCRTVWIDYGYRERGPSQPPEARVGSLEEAVDWIRAQMEGQ